MSTATRVHPRQRDYDALTRIAHRIVKPDVWHQIAIEAGLADDTAPPVLLKPLRIQHPHDPEGQPNLVIDVRPRLAKTNPDPDAFDLFAAKLRRHHWISCSDHVVVERDPGVLRIWLAKAELPRLVERAEVPVVGGDLYELGVGPSGRILWDAGAFPHGLIAGPTRSGKGSILRWIVRQAIARGDHGIIVAPKIAAEMRKYAPNRATDFADDADPGRFAGWPVVSDPAEIATAIAAAEREMDRRMALCEAYEAERFSELPAVSRHLRPRLFVIVDEIGEVNGIKGLDSKDPIREQRQGNFNRLSRMARLSGALDMNFLALTQHPMVEVLGPSGALILNNLQLRVLVGNAGAEMREMVLGSRAKDSAAIGNVAKGRAAAVNFHPRFGADAVRIQIPIMKGDPR